MVFPDLPYQLFYFFPYFMLDDDGKPGDAFSFGFGDSKAFYVNTASAEQDSDLIQKTDRIFSKDTNGIGCAV